jgi:hypothetical protein
MIGKTKLLTDEPLDERGGSKRDGLGFKTYARVLAEAALGTKGPFTIGVFGEWGTGKTSLMHLIQEQLNGQDDVVTVWFNAWRFEQEEHPIVPLVATIIRGLLAKDGFLDKIKGGGKAFVTALRAIAYGFAGKAKIGIPGFAEVEAAFVAKDMIEREDALRPDPLLDRSLYFEAFERLSQIEVGDQVKIVVIIDDLDRCFPDRAIKLLESIKLVLSQPGFIFVLGVSPKVIQGYLQHRYEEDYGLKGFNGGAYLDKIVQLPFHIPPHRERMKTLSKTLLNQLQPNDREALEGILPLVGIACNYNPRATVRFVNNLLIDKAIYRALRALPDTDESKPDTNAGEIPINDFAVTRALQQRWPDVFAILDSSPNLCSEAANWEPDSISDYTHAKDPQQATLAAHLSADKGLRELLLIHGKAWLRNEIIRDAAIQFLWQQRAEGKTAKFRLLPSEFAVLVHFPRDEETARQIAGALMDAGLPIVTIASDRLPTDADPEARLWSGLSSPPLVCLLGSDWKTLLESDRTRNILLSLSSRLYFIQLPTAYESLRAKVPPHILNVRLPEQPTYPDDLMPLVTSLRSQLRRPEDYGLYGPPGDEVA